MGTGTAFARHMRTVGGMQRQRACCRDLRKRLFGRYKRAEKKAAAAGGGEAERPSRRSRSPERETRETSEERRARIAEWSRKRKEGATEEAAK